MNKILLVLTIFFITGKIFSIENLTKTTDEITQTTQDDCTTIDMDAPGGSTSLIPRTTQAIGTCYAHTISVMYDAQRIKNSTQFDQKFSSPIDISYLITKNSNDTDLEAGRIDQILLLNNNPPCPNEHLSKSLKPEIDPHEIEYEDLKNNLVALSKKMKINSDSEISNFTKKDKLVRKYNRTLNRSIECSNPKSDKFEDIFAILKHQDFSESYSIKMKTFCEQSKRNALTKPIKIVYDSFNDYSVNDINPKSIVMSENQAQLNFKKINETIKSNHDLPLAIGLCSKGILRGSKVKPNQLTAENCGQHGIPLVGRRYNESTKVCEYKFRNFWGRNKCFAYNSQIDCDKKTGDIYIPEDLLKKVLLLVTQID